MEEGVVHYPDACTGEEVAGELRAGPRHGERAAGEHEGSRTAAAAVHLQAALVEGHAAAVGAQYLGVPCLRRDARFGNGAVGHLIEIRVLVCAEEYDAARGHGVVLRLGRSLHGVGNETVAESGRITAPFLHFLEELPCLLGDALREVFDIIGTAGGVYHVIEMGLVLEQQLHIAGDARGDSVGLS